MRNAFLRFGSLKSWIRIKRRHKGLHISKDQNKHCVKRENTETRLKNSSTEALWTLLQGILYYLF